MYKLGAITVVAALLLSFQVAWADHHEAPAGEAGGMPMMSDGDIVHTEMYASDLGAAESFYGGLFGWTFTPMDDTYVTFMDASGTHSGGFSTMLPEGQPTEMGRWTTVVYIYCSDIEAKLAEIEAAGGMTYVPKTPIPGIGHFAMFGDPFGNAVGLFVMEMGEPAPDAYAGHDHGHDHSGHDHSH
jgi:predicted enzyme related to lactoylglutathione lyase